MQQKQEVRPATSADSLPKPLLDQAQLMTWLGVSRWYVEQMIKFHGLPVEYVKGTGRKPLRRFDQDKVNAWRQYDSAAA